MGKDVVGGKATIRNKDGDRIGSREALFQLSQSEVLISLTSRLDYGITESLGQDVIKSDENDLIVSIGGCAIRREIAFCLGRVPCIRKIRAVAGDKLIFFMVQRWMKVSIKLIEESGEHIREKLVALLNEGRVRRDSRRIKGEITQEFHL